MVTPESAGNVCTLPLQSGATAAYSGPIPSTSQSQSEDTQSAYSEETNSRDSFQGRKVVCKSNLFKYGNMTFSLTSCRYLHMISTTKEW